MDRWEDFLENGHLHWHDDPSRFDFDDFPGADSRAPRIPGARIC
jgi:hypothetical protein